MPVLFVKSNVLFTLDFGQQNGVVLILGGLGRLGSRSRIGGVGCRLHSIDGLRVLDRDSCKAVEKRML